jgi:dynactin-6
MAPKSRLSEAALIKPPTTLSSTILISEGAQLIGTHPIHIGDHTVLHPRCRILLAAPDEKGLVVEDYVVVEMNAVVEARRIGEGTVVEVGVKVGKAADVGKVSDDS